MHHPHSGFAHSAFLHCSNLWFKDDIEFISSRTLYHWISFLPDWFNISGGTFGCRPFCFPNTLRHNFRLETFILAYQISGQGRRVDVKHELVRQHRDIMIRGFQMLVLVMMFNLAITFVAFLAFIQFFWMLITQQKNTFLADLGTIWKNWFGAAIEFLLGTSDIKPFPWSSVN